MAHSVNYAIPAFVNIAILICSCLSCGPSPTVRSKARWALSQVVASKPSEKTPHAALISKSRTDALCWGLWHKSDHVQEHTPNNYQSGTQHTKVFLCD